MSASLPGATPRQVERERFWAEYLALAERDVDASDELWLTRPEGFAPPGTMWAQWQDLADAVGEAVNTIRDGIATSLAAFVERNGLPR